jgi:hypothetical protein
MRAETVTVRFTLTTPDGTAVPGARVRVVIGDGIDGSQPATGTTFTTGMQGEHEFTTRAVLGSRRRKMPTNFWTELAARRQPTDHLRIATELEYGGHRFVYLSSVDRFPDGTCAQLDGLAIFGLDAGGRFAAAAWHGRQGWTLPGIAGTGLASPGHSVSDLVLARDPLEPDHWTLRLGYWRFPDPVVRA